YEITVAICFDVYDPTVFLSLVLKHVKNLSEYQKTIVLVPSFNPSPDFVELLRDLSFLAQCPVIYVNWLHGDARAFVCGFAISALVRRLPAVKEGIRARIAELESDVDVEQRAFAAEASRSSAYDREEEAQRQVAFRRNRLAALQE